ncbi:MAG: hypothetical protein MZV64_65015 [Ignavibacteriales bacterium]|nr:hypothetical protein [Ignavibacteriales bacterium]
MTDKINEKVINIFTRHKKQLPPLPHHEKVVRSEDGFYYVCVKGMKMVFILMKKKILNKVSDVQYIVKVMMKQTDYPNIYNFKVPGSKLLEFLEPYIKGEKAGTIIEVDKYYPHDLA